MHTDLRTASMCIGIGDQQHVGRPPALVYRYTPSMGIKPSIVDNIIGGPALLQNRDNKNHLHPTYDGG